MSHARPWLMRAGQGLAALLVLAYAFAAVSNGLDRRAALRPALERLVPAPFRADADLAAATRAFAAQDLAAAQRHAEQAVRHAPVSAEALGKLGTARLLGGDGTGAAKAFQVAAQTGWRDIATQMYWHDAALAAGDHGVAAQRLDAILRTRPHHPEGQRLIATLEASAEGREALARQLAGRPKWLSLFMAPHPETSVETLLHRADVSHRIAASGTRLGCDAVTTLTRRLIETQQLGSAQQVWRGHCGPVTAQGGLNDPEFRQLARLGDARPFGWRRHPSGDVTIAAVTGAAGKITLQVANRDSVSQPVLSQPVYLAPGHYRLELGMEGGATTEALAGSLACANRLERAAFASGAPLVAGDCTPQLFSLWLAPRTPDLVITAIRLSRVE